MGDTQLQTVMNHYFDTDYLHMQTETERFELPSEIVVPAEAETNIASARTEGCSGSLVSY